MVNPDTALLCDISRDEEQSSDSAHLCNVAEMRLNRKLTRKINPYTALLCDFSRDGIELEFNGNDSYTALFCDVSRSDMRLVRKLLEKIN